jgi:hypothetical protein
LLVVSTFTGALVVVVLGGDVVVGTDVTGACCVVVVTTVVVEVAREGSARGGEELVDALREKTRTNRRIGLDHIIHCVLLSEWRSLMEVLEGRLPGQGEIVVHS